MLMFFRKNNVIVSNQNQQVYRRIKFTDYEMRVTINALDVDFTAILVTAVVENNALKTLTISYTMTVNSLKLKAMGIGVDGNGAGKMTVTYTCA